MLALHHETKREVALKFFLVAIVVGIYFLFVSSKYGTEKGIFVTLLTWSFFVFCTPIADAGLLFDFPMRLILGIRMLYAEIFVWLFAFLLNVYALSFSPSVYETTGLLQILHAILTNPTHWIIILLSAAGTFLSVYFGDELLDVATHKEREKYFRHKNKWTMILAAFIVVAIVFLYSSLLEELNINVPLV